MSATPPVYPRHQRPSASPPWDAAPLHRVRSSPASAQGCAPISTAPVLKSPASAPRHHAGSRPLPAQFGPIAPAKRQDLALRDACGNHTTSGAGPNTAHIFVTRLQTSVESVRNQLLALMVEWEQTPRPHFAPPADSVYHHESHPGPRSDRPVPSCGRPPCPLIGCRFITLDKDNSLAFMSARRRALLSLLAREIIGRVRARHPDHWFFRTVRIDARPRQHVVVARAWWLWPKPPVRRTRK